MEAEINIKWLPLHFHNFLLLCNIMQFKTLERRSKRIIFNLKLFLQNFWKFREFVLERERKMIFKYFLCDACDRQTVGRWWERQAPSRLSLLQLPQLSLNLTFNADFQCQSWLSPECSWLRASVWAQVGRPTECSRGCVGCLDRNHGCFDKHNSRKKF